MKTVTRREVSPRYQSPVVGPIVVLHASYRIKGAPSREAGPAAVICQSEVTLFDLHREALLAAAGRPRWSAVGASSDSDGYPLSKVIYPDAHHQSDAAFREDIDRALHVFDRRDWREFARQQTGWIHTRNKSRFGHALNLALKDKATVILVGVCREYFDGGDLGTLAAQWLAATYGPGGVYRSKAKA